VLALAVLSAACATTQPRVHTLSELGNLATRCDVASHTLAQHQERPELFYFLDPTASEAQLLCVGRWAKKNHLRLVYVEAVVEEEAEAQP
jgi:hypothetical protein